MSKVDEITNKLRLYGISESHIKDITESYNLVGIISKMEECLTPDIVQHILDSCACGGGDEFNMGCEETDRNTGSITLGDKIDHLISIADEFENIVLNADNTITVTWSFTNNGKYICQCPAAAMCTDMPLSYCLCCAGSCRRYFQSKTGIELKSKMIVSSPINTSGEKPCSFIFDVVCV